MTQDDISVTPSYAEKRRDDIGRNLWRIGFEWFCRRYNCTTKDDAYMAFRTEYEKNGRATSGESFLQYVNRRLKEMGQDALDIERAKSEGM